MKMSPLQLYMPFWLTKLVPCIKIHPLTCTSLSTFWRSRSLCVIFCWLPLFQNPLQSKSIVTHCSGAAVPEQLIGPTFLKTGLGKPASPRLGWGKPLPLAQSSLNSLQKWLKMARLCGCARSKSRWNFRECRWHLPHRAAEGCSSNLDE